jgi:predicted amidohydrolase YtcJ
VKIFPIAEGSHLSKLFMKFNPFFAYVPFLLGIILISCDNRQTADLIVHHAEIYTVNDNFELAEAFAIKDGKFLAVGSNSEILDQYHSDSILDLEGSFLYPGFIDAHAHFFGYGTGLQMADLSGLGSFHELVEKVLNHRKNFPDQTWILGRGWDQNLWEGKEFPKKDTLDKLFPDTPVLLTRIDGHAALANQTALNLGEINASTSISGGKVILDKGLPTGVLIDNAIDKVSAKIPQLGESDVKKALLTAQENCFKVGLTTVADAGLDRQEIELIEKLQKEGSLKMRIYAMVNPTPSNKAYYFEKGPFQNDRLTIKSFKVYGDGALGSRGAALLAPYHDSPGEQGFLLSSEEELANLAKEMYQQGFQMNTHCIGDSTNRILLDIYSKVLKGENNRRWRIEHAQVVHPDDIEKFAQYQIIPSVQPTHATSDMYWAKERLGPERITYAYTYKNLLDQNGMIALGSDFPVESINPLYGFHSAVARKDGNNWPEQGFQSGIKLNREEALKGMTIWAAYANFEEEIKGSIEAGKFADFVILQKDIMDVPEEEIRDMAVSSTYIGGEKVY